MSLLVVIQARETGSRLPGKIRSELTPGISMLAHVVARASMLGPFVVAMPEQGDNENDVLSRFVRVARHNPEADAFVRITADCPLLDVGVGAHIINLYRGGVNDFVGTTPEMDGLDVEVFSRTALMMADLHAHGRSAREHVTRWMRRNLSPLLVCMVDEPCRWSVDDSEGLGFVRDVYRACEHCAQAVPHHTNASGSISGGDRRIVVDLHHMPAGDLAECKAADLKRGRMGGDVYISR
jgi:spore coat polysaccharide biosynthesis protein SpsF (cytidylyltransferase family)